MGTRRSRHNKGRKPLYKEHRLTAADVLAQSAFRPWWNTNFTWQEKDKEKLAVLVDANADLADSAKALGRSQKAIAWRARDSGLELPSEWSKAISPIYIPKVREPGIILAYPYIIKRRDEHSDLLAINALVPKAFPHQMRADICQEIALALLEGSVTLDELRANRQKSAWFYKNFWMANHEQSGHAVSLAWLNDYDRSYDEIASSISAKEWHQGQVAEQQRFINSMSATYQPPTQIDEVWHKQIESIQRALAARGEIRTFVEVAHMVEDEGYRGVGAEKDHRSHAVVRAEKTVCKRRASQPDHPSQDQGGG